MSAVNAACGGHGELPAPFPGIDFRPDQESIVLLFYSLVWFPQCSYDDIDLDKTHVDGLILSRYTDATSKEDLAKLFKSVH